MALEWWSRRKHPVPVGVPGLWDLHLPYQKKVGPQDRLPSQRTAPLIGWILEEPPPIDSTAIEFDPNGYFEVWLQSAAIEGAIEVDVGVGAGVAEEDGKLADLALALLAPRKATIRSSMFQ